MLNTESKLIGEVRMGKVYDRVVRDLMRGLGGGAAAHIAPLPQGNVALFVFWPRFQGMSDEKRRAEIENALVASAQINPKEYFSGIHCYTPSEHEELSRNDILVFPGEGFAVTVSLLHELKAGDALAIEWSGPIDSGAGQDLPVYASTVERVTETIYNVKGTVPAGYPPGLYRNVKALVTDPSGNT